MPSKNGRAHAWMAFGSMCVMSLVLNGICWNCITLYADPIISEWNISRSAFMLVITILSGINTCVSFFLYGRLVAKLGLRRLIFVGGLLMAAGHVLFALADGIGMLYAGALLFGLGVSVTSDNTYNVACTAWFAKRRSTMIGIVGTVGTVTATFFASAVALVIIAIGWRGSFWITAAIVLVGTALWTWLYKGEPEKMGEKPLYADEVSGEERLDEDSGVPWTDMFKYPQTYLLMIAWLFVGIAGFAVRGNLPLFAVDYGYGEMSGPILSALLASCAVFMPLGGWLCDRFNSRVMVFTGMLGVIAASLMLCLPELPLWALFVAAVLLGFGWDCNIVPIAPCILETFGRRDFPRKTGLFVGFQALGVAIAPTLLSLFADLNGGSYVLGLLLMVVLSVAVLITYVLGNRKIEV